MGPVELTAPYVDFDTGLVLITASQAFFTAPQALFGVMGIDVDISEINAALTSSRVLTNGYMFMIDNNGTLII